MTLGLFSGGCFFKITLMFIEAVISSNNFCSKCFLIAFTYDFEQATQNRSHRGKNITEWLKMKVSRITLRWAGQKVYNGCKNQAIFHGRVRDDVEKKMWTNNIDKRRTTTKWRSKMKRSYKNEMKITNEMKIKNNDKNLLGGSPKQSTI